MRYARDTDRPTADKCPTFDKRCTLCGARPDRPCQGAQFEVPGTESIGRRKPSRQRGLFEREAGR